MANYVYGPDEKGKGPGSLPTGWVLSDYANELITLEDPNNGFYSELYERTNADGSITYVYATRGTEGPHDAGEDIRQPLGLPAYQYELSVRNANTLSSWLGDNPLYFVGHSLGGGLASANALATGRDAITFNAAGLSRETRHHNSLQPYANYVADGNRIDAYVLSGEIVSRAQSVSVQQVLLLLLRPLLGSDMPKLKQSADKHGLRAEGSLHELAMTGLLTGRAAQGEKNRFYRLPADLGPAERALLLKQKSQLTRLLLHASADRLVPVSTLLDIVNFFSGFSQSLNNHSMDVVEALLLLQKEPLEGD